MSEGASTTITRSGPLRASPAAITRSRDCSRPRAASGSSAAYRVPVPDLTSAARHTAPVSAVPSSCTGVTTSVGRSSAARPVISLDTSTCRPRINVATPPDTGSARSAAATDAGSPGRRHDSVGGVTCTRDGAAMLSHGATSRAVVDARLLGAANS